MRTCLIAVTGALFLLAGCSRAGASAIVAPRPGMPLAAAASTEVRDELARALVPLATAMPEGATSDLTPFGRAIRRARVVGLGEATHGTAEIFRMKHRLFRYLVERHGFTVFTIEANWASTLAADRYVKTGDGSAEAALTEMGFWTWRTVEVRDLLRWIRAYNQAHGPVLSVAGFDMQDPRPSAEALPRYLRPLEPRLADLAAQASGPLAQAGYKYGELPAAVRVEVRAALARLARELDAARPRLVAATSERAFGHARRHMRVLIQAERASGAEKASHDDVNARDEAMAENLAWLVEEEFAGQRLVAWAHDGHVGAHRIPGRPSWTAMGWHLRERLGPAWYGLGFSLHRGELRAIRTENGAGKGLAVLPLAPAEPGSVDEVMHAAGRPLAFLDLRGVQAGGALGAWLDSEQYKRSIGAIYDPAQPRNYYWPVVPAAVFDGLIHLDETHATMPLQDAPSHLGTMTAPTPLRQEDPALANRRPEGIPAR